MAGTSERIELLNNIEQGVKGYDAMGMTDIIHMIYTFKISDFWSKMHPEFY